VTAAEAPESPVDPWVYVVTDIEVDGPWPGPNSLRSFASVAVTASGEERGTFEAVLAPLPRSDVPTRHSSRGLRGVSLTM
jgi:hypothetical protein